MTFINTFSCVSEKIRLDISCEISAKQRIHIKYKVLHFLLKVNVKKKEIKVLSAAILLGTLRDKALLVNSCFCSFYISKHLIKMFFQTPVEPVFSHVFGQTVPSNQQTLP